MTHSTQRDNVIVGAKGADDMQTPGFAIEPLIPHLARLDIQTIWEPACGKGNLEKAFNDAFYSVIGTDIKHRYSAFQLDFLTEPLILDEEEGEKWDVIVTNPPFKLKDQFLARCYELGKSFALLMPYTALEGLKRQALYRKHGIQLILMDKRISFETPSGKQGGAWFPTAWFTWGLNLPQDLNFYEFPKEAKPCLF